MCVCVGVCVLCVCMRARARACVYPHTTIIIVLGLIQINDYRTIRDFGFDRCMVYLTRIRTITFRTRLNIIANFILEQ